ncbi:MAG TPA: hypothetical protein VFW21_09035 [Mycobacterium sp.]|nr:hypothetical protein [Mycobacterium sp.]
MPRVLLTAMATATFAAFGFAGTVHADPAMLNGTYTVVGGDEGTFHWTVASHCRVRGCTAIVSSNRGWSSGGRYGPDGQLSFTVTKPDGVICSDGSYAPAFIAYSVDPTTLGGVMSADSNFRCPGGIISRTPFQLQQVA